MEAKNSEIITAFEALREMAEVYLPVSGALKVRRIAKELQNRVEEVEEVRKQLVTKYGAKDENGEVIVLENGVAQIEDMEGFSREYKELMEISSSYDTVLTKEDLGSGEVKVQTVIKLGPWLED